jgi:cytosine/adenosine deaminase-related metal-dependent hydrolase
MLTNRRGAACFPDGAASLLRCATQNGARSLALDTNIGQLRVGYKADFIALDLDAAPLHGCTIDQLVDAFVFGCSTGDVVRENCVNGVLRRY